MHMGLWREEDGAVRVQPQSDCSLSSSFLLLGLFFCVNTNEWYQGVHSQCVFVHSSLSNAGMVWLLR